MRKIGIVGAVVAGLLLAAPARASEEIRTALKELAEDIRKVVRDQPVKIGEFGKQGIAGNANFGSGIEKMLETELNALGKGAVNDKAKYEVIGRYGVFVLKKDGKELAQARITAKVTEIDSGEELKNSDVRVDINGSEGVGKIGGGTGVFVDKNGNSNPLPSIRNPTFFLDGNKVLARKGGLLAVEVRVKPRVGASSSAIKPIEDTANKVALVEIPRDQLYEVVVTNNFSFHVGITLTIDGLDVFEFSLDRGVKGRPKYQHFIIPPYTSALLKGWHHTSDPKREDNVLSFLVTEYGKGAASAKKVARGKVGVLSVTLAAAWADYNEETGKDKNGNFVPENKRCPKDEPYAGRRSANETALGPPDKQKFKEVAMTVGQVREIVTVRYSR